MQRRCTITTATLAGVSANITQPSIHPVYAKCANDGYLLFDASARGQRPKRPLSSRLNHLPAPPAPVSQRSLASLTPLAPLACNRASRRQGRLSDRVHLPPSHGG